MKKKILYSGDKESDPEVLKKIYAYVRKHFKDAFLSKIKKTREANNAVYELEADSDGIIYYLKFNSTGVIKNVDSEVVLESGYE